jgi:hypothetical protein
MPSSSAPSMPRFPNSLTSTFEVYTRQRMQRVIVAVVCPHRSLVAAP